MNLIMYTDVHYSSREEIKKKRQVRPYGVYELRANKNILWNSLKKRDIFQQCLANYKDRIHLIIRLKMLHSKILRYSKLLKSN